MTKTVHGYIYGPFSVHSRNYLTHARAVDTRPFLSGWEGPGYEAKSEATVTAGDVRLCVRFEVCSLELC